MTADAVEYARRCKARQIHVDFMHQPPELLHPTIASWPFDAWGIDVVGLISPSSAKGHGFILAITDYFSKWAKAAPLAKVKITNVVNFIKHHVIHRFGAPGRSSTIMVPNWQANCYIGPAISTEFRMWL